MEDNILLELPTQEYLLECFDYNPETGILTWKERPLHHFKKISTMKRFNKLYANKDINNLNLHGYVNIKIDYIEYRAHRLIWKLYYGLEPSSIIDHINGIKNDNRICNLREATNSENCINLNNLVSRNKSNYTGVHYNEKRKVWCTSLGYKGKEVYIGRYNTKEEAKLARELKVIELYGEEFYFKNENNKILLEELKLKVEEIKKNPKVKIYNKKGEYIGVSIDKRSGEYLSELMIDKKRYRSSGYKTKEEAVLARELKMLEILGEEEYTKQNRMSFLEELKEKVDVIKQERNSNI